MRFLENFADSHNGTYYLNLKQELTLLMQKLCIDKEEIIILKANAGLRTQNSISCK